MTEREYLQQGPDVLALACGRGDLALAKLALLAGIGPDEPNAAGRTPMALAVERKDRPLIRLLIEHGAKTNAAEAANVPGEENRRCADQAIQSDLSS
jgi:ankyrin repeat protein